MTFGSMTFLELAAVAGTNAPIMPIGWALAESLEMRRGWEDEVAYRGVSMARRTEFHSSNGPSGEHQLRSAANGAYLFANALGALEEFINDIRTWPMPEGLRHA